MMARLWVALVVALGAASALERSHVLFATDAQQFQGLAAALASVVSSSSGGDGVVAFTVVVPAQDVAAVERLARCALEGAPATARVVAVEATATTRLADAIASYPRPEGGEYYGNRGNLSSLLNYARFYLPEILPPDAKTVLYVDVDLVVRCDVRRLLGRGLREFATAAAAAGGPASPLGGVIFAADRGKCFGSKRLCKRCEGHNSFNAGVFAADLDRWRESRATERLEASVRATVAALNAGDDKTLWSQPSSQDPMVDVFCKDYVPLGSGRASGDWNVLFNTSPRGRAPLNLGGFFRDPTDKRADGCIWHFKGHPKPWDPWPTSNGTSARNTHWTARLFEPYARPCCVDAAPGCAGRRR